MEGGVLSVPDDWRERLVRTAIPMISIFTGLCAIVMAETHVQRGVNVAPKINCCKRERYMSGMLRSRMGGGYLIRRRRMAMRAMGNTRAAKRIR